MIVILDSLNKTLTQLATDHTNGLGQLSPISCTIEEELNGIYEATLKVAQSDAHFSDLSVGGVLKMPVDETGDFQMFRIYFISKVIEGIAEIRCAHITYDLTKIPVGPFTATGAVSAKNGMLSNVIGTSEFTMSTDITNTTSTFTLDIPRSFRECLGGYEGSLLDVFRGEYKWDNLEVKMLAKRGADNGVRIAYGKNLVDFEQEENNENVYDAVYGYAVVNDVTYTASSVYNKTGAAFPRVKIVDFSSDYETDDIPTAAELLTKATSYATNNDIEIPKINISIDFVPLWQTDEYKDILPLERVSLGDTVHVFFEKMGVEASSRVVKTVWNVLTQKYDSIELGSIKANLNTVINDSMQDVKDDIMSNISIDTGFIEEELAEMGDLVVNGLGLFITRNVLIDGSERIVLHNKPDLASSDIQYYISANGLVVSTDYGATWNAGFTPQGDAVFNALSANIIRALQIYGSFLRFGDVNSNYIDVAPYSENNVPQGVSFDGTGSIRMKPQGAFYIYNSDANSNPVNSLYMYKETDVNRVDIVNYNYEDSSKLDNTISLISRVYSDGSKLASISITNEKYGQNKAANSIYIMADEYVMNGVTYYTTSANITNRNAGAQRPANALSMTSSSFGSQVVSIENYRYGDSNYANRIRMEYTAQGGRILSLSNYDPNNSLANEIMLSHVNGIVIHAYEDDVLISSDSGGVYIQSHKLKFENGYVRY